MSAVARASALASRGKCYPTGHNARMNAQLFHRYIRYRMNFIPAMFHISNVGSGDPYVLMKHVARVNFLVESIAGVLFDGVSLPDGIFADGL